MSTYATEFEHSDGDDDELCINRCVNEHHALMIYMGGFRYGVELWREDVERLTAYLASIVDKVPARPAPEPAPQLTYDSAGVIADGQIVWRTVCYNTLAFTDKERT